MSRRRPSLPGAGSRNGLAYAFTSLTPIAAGRDDELATHLLGLADGVSPFAALPHVHFARWLVIDQLKMGWPGAPRRPTRLESSYLLFTSMVTAPDARAADDLPGSFLRDLAQRIPTEADAVWAHCVGYPGAAAADAFVRYLTASQLDTELFHVGYPGATVDQVRRAVAARDALAAFAAGHQGDVDPAELQRDYLRESATWTL